jgi:SET domain-containing protein
MHQGSVSPNGEKKKVPTVQGLSQTRVCTIQAGMSPNTLICASTSNHLSNACAMSLQTSSKAEECFLKRGGLAHDYVDAH